jgi:hypothetical protein
MDGFDGVDSPLYRWSVVGAPTITMLAAASTRLGQGQAVRLVAAAVANGLSRSVAGVATLHVGFAARFTGGVGTNAAGIIFLGDGGTLAHTALRFDVPAGTITAARGSVQSTTTLGSAPAGVTLSNWNYYEIRMVLSDAAGQVEVRVNGSATPALNLSGVDTKNAGTGTVYDAIRLCADGSGNGADYDDVVIHD